jgi:hypothetical protein
MDHDANCPTCHQPCTWQRSETTFAGGIAISTVYFHRCGDCRKKFTHKESARFCVTTNCGSIYYNADDDVMRCAAHQDRS